MKQNKDDFIPMILSYDLTKLRYPVFLSKTCFLCNKTNILYLVKNKIVEERKSDSYIVCEENIKALQILSLIFHFLFKLGTKWHKVVCRKLSYNTVIENNIDAPKGQINFVA